MKGRSYTIHNLAYIGGFTGGIRDHFLSFGAYPPRPATRR
jgi:hypothetical protein